MLRTIRQLKVLGTSLQPALDVSLSTARILKNCGVSVCTSVVDSHERMYFELNWPLKWQRTLL